ncbi:MAG: hypothetical protein OXE55_00365 [Flavobacteriaceae bacterium]|nr:hypothetical protein [Flavobacteriaceae bacterium]MCY4253767.1 hypothetical protein [Flavobacteriaceae bacterium]
MGRNLNHAIQLNKSRYFLFPNTSIQLIHHLNWNHQYAFWPFSVHIHGDSSPNEEPIQTIDRRYESYGYNDTV